MITTLLLAAAITATPTAKFQCVKGHIYKWTYEAVWEDTEKSCIQLAPPQETKWEQIASETYHSVSTDIEYAPAESNMRVYDLEVLSRLDKIERRAPFDPTWVYVGLAILAGMNLITWVVIRDTKEQKGDAQ